MNLKQNHSILFQGSSGRFRARGKLYERPKWGRLPNSSFLSFPARTGQAADGRENCLSATRLHFGRSLTLLKAAVRES